MMEVKAFVCEYNNCNLIYENPVSLACGNTLCNEHLEKLNENTTFICEFCKQEHQIPTNGMAINKTIHKIIESFIYLDPVRRKIKETFDNLYESIDKYEKIDPDFYIYDYFGKIRNKIDLHREELIEEIHLKSEQLIKHLKEKEEKCKLNLKNLTKLNLNELKTIVIPSWKRELRIPDFSQEKQNELLIKMKQHLHDIQHEMIKYKRKLLLSESIEFDKFEKSSLFGHLIITNSDFSLSENCGQLIKSYSEHSSLIRSFQVNEISNRMISVSNDKTIRVWNLETGECLKSIKKHQSAISSVLIIPNNRFVTGSDDKTIKIWDLESYEYLNTITNESGVSCLCLISNTEIACGCNDGTINIWNLEYLNKVNSIRAHNGWIPYLKLTENCQLISCSSDKNIRIWNLNPFKCQKELTGHLNTVYLIDLTIDNRLLSCSSDKTIKLWNFETGEILKSIEFDHSVYCFEILNDDLLAVGVGNDKHGEIQIYNLNKDDKMIQKISAHSSFVYRLKLMSSNGNLLSGCGNGDIKSWKILDNIKQG